MRSMTDEGRPRIKSGGRARRLRAYLTESTPSMANFREHLPPVCAGAVTHPVYESLGNPASLQPRARLSASL